MALTRSFKELVQKPVARDPAFGEDLQASSCDFLRVQSWSLWGFCCATFENPCRLRRHQAPSPPKPRSGTIASGAGSG